MHVILLGVPVAPHADNGLRSRMHRFGQQGRNNRNRLNLATTARMHACRKHFLPERRRHDRLRRPVGRALQLWK